MPMITRNRIKISEGQIALMWQQLVGKELTSAEGEPVKVIYPGRINGDNGPDFKDAVIVNESNSMKGDVEVHVKSSDWYSHGHHRNAGYNGVILHVVGWHDCSSATSLQNGKLVPVLCLSEQACLKPYRLPCFQILRHMDKQTLGRLLNTAGEERFKQKAMHFQARMQCAEAGQVLFQGVMRALGYSKNITPFEELAHRLPLNSIERMEPRRSLVLKEAWLLGMAGLLPSQRSRGEFPQGEEIRKLEQAWQSVDKQAEAMKEDDWNFAHIYPNNSPVRRIVAQSYLLQRYHEGGLLMGILQLVKEAPTARHLEDGLIVFGDGYWQDHYDFDGGCKTRTSALLGCSKAREVVVNVVLTFAFSWGEVAEEPKLKEKAIRFYLNYPKLAENEITRHMVKQLCLEDISDFTACHQQGLIHIFRSYCREGRCAPCPLDS